MAKKNVTRNKIAKHYKKFFAIEDMGLAENDQLMIDWGMALIEDSRASAKPLNENSALPIPNVSGLLPANEDVQRFLNAMNKLDESGLLSGFMIDNKVLFDQLRWLILE